MNMKSVYMLVFASLLLAACGATAAQSTPAPIATVQADDAIIAEGRVEPVHYAEIAFNASGVVSEVLVEEGQQVKKNQALVRLGNSETARAEVARAEEALIVAERAFNAAQADTLKTLGDAYEAVRKAQYDLDNFDVPSELAQGTPADGVEKMYAKLDVARQAFEPYKNLSERRLRLTPAEQNDEVYRDTAKLYKKRLDDAWADFNKAIRWAKLEADLQAAKSELGNAQKEFAALADGSQETSLARAKYETAQANLAAAQAALANVELVAPFDGVVAGLNVKVGGSINAGEIAVTVADFSSWVVKTTDLTELDVVNIEEGQAATVRLDAIPDVTLNGKIESIGQSFAEKQGDIVYEVTVGLTDTNPNMRWGMTAEVKFGK